MQMESSFDQIYSTLRNERIEIRKESFIEFFNSEDPDVLGLCYDFMTDEDSVKRISPELTWKEAHDLVRGYYKKCIKNNYSSDWADSRLFATLDCVAWIDSTWKSLGEPEREEWVLWVDSLKEIDSIAFSRLHDHLKKIRKKYRGKEL